jgi:hypothetical protein
VRARLRSHCVIGLAWSAASLRNSALAQVRLNVAIDSSASGSAPSRPNSDGIHTVKPASRTQRAKRARCGLMPGVSGIPITAGPRPPTCTVRDMASMSIRRGVKSSNGSGSVSLRWRRAGCCMGVLSR